VLSSVMGAAIAVSKAFHAVSCSRAACKTSASTPTSLALEMASLNLARLGDVLATSSSAIAFFWGNSLCKVTLIMSMISIGHPCFFASSSAFSTVCNAA